MFDLSLLVSILFAVILMAVGTGLGWQLCAIMKDRKLEMRAQAADIEWLRNALADSEKRCAQQAEWLHGMEQEHLALRGDDRGTAGALHSLHENALGRPVSVS